jgi:type I restriction enzyme S subunit
MNKYQLYKPSGVEWVGDIPNNWDISRIKKFFIERNEKVNDFEFPPLSVTKNGVVPQLENVSKSDNHDDRKKVCPNDFVINSRSDRKGSSGVSKLSGSVSLINIVLEPRNIYPSYSEYLFKSYNFIEEFFKNGKGIHWDLWSTRYSELKNILIPVPSLQEQIQIVQFLDKRT